MMDKKQEHYEKVKKILTSCMNRDHLKTAVKVINQFNKQYRIGEYDPEYITLKRLLDLMKVKCGVKTKSYNGGEQLIDEEFFASAKEWAKAAAHAGLKGIFFEEDKIKGGLADDKTIKDIAKKHNVKVGDIRKQIDMGIDVEREHTDSDKIAREIAMDHEDEFPRYYDALADMEKDLEKGEELEEATAGGSAGAYEGLFSTQPVRQELHKTNVPVVDAGGMTKPIGKVRSFRRRNESKTYTKSQLKETNVFSKEEIMNEAVDSDAALGQYDTSGWGNSEFMLTKPKRGKKGKVRVRKGKDYKKTYDYDTGSSTFVKIKDKCKKFPYCVQSPDAIELSKTPFNENKELEKLIEGICKKTGKSKKYVHSLINRYL